VRLYGGHQRLCQLIADRIVDFLDAAFVRKLGFERIDRQPGQYRRLREFGNAIRI
jgi:hypothetical protein